MAINRKSGGGNVALTTAKRRSGAAWVNLTIAKVRKAGAWVDLLLSPLVASVTDSTPEGDQSGTVASRLVTSNTTTASATGGTGGTKTYSWARISGSTTITATAPSAATTAFSATISDVRDDQPTVVSAVFRCTVSDGTYTATVDVTVTLSYENSLV